MVSRIIPVEPADLVIFGSTGDLARRKILPALFRRFCAGQIGPESRVIGASRTELDDKGFRKMASDAIAEFSEHEGCDMGRLKDFLAMLHYVTLDAQGHDRLEGAGEAGEI